MLYKDPSLPQSFPALEKTLKSLGFTQQTIDNGMRYLSATDADETLLDDIQQKLISSNKFVELYNLEHAVKKEIYSRNNGELEIRYINFAFAAAGVTSVYLSSFGEIHLMNRIDPEKMNKIVLALRRTLGDRAEAAVFACGLIANKNIYKSVSDNEKTGMELYLQAADFITDEAAELYPRARMLLSCIILSESEPPSEQPPKEPVVKFKLFTGRKKLSDAASKAVDMLLDIVNSMQGKLSAEDTYVLIGAIAQAAYFSDTAASIYYKSIPGHSAMVLLHLQLMPYDSSRVVKLLEANESTVTPDYIIELSHTKGNEKHLERLARRYPKNFAKAVLDCNSAETAKELEQILSESSPETAAKINVADSQKKLLAETVARYYPERDKIYKYIIEGGDFNEVYVHISKQGFSNYGKSAMYYKVYGADEYFCRTLAVIVCTGEKYGHSYRINNMTGFDPTGREDEMLEYVMKGGASLTQALKGTALYIENSYFNKDKKIILAAAAASRYPERLKNCDTSAFDATARVILARAYGNVMDKFRPELLGMTDDGSKAVRDTVAEVLSYTDWYDDISALLKAKKAGRREIALTVIEKQGAEKYAEALRNAFEAEKSDKLRLRIGALIGEKNAAKELVQTDIAGQIAKLAKNSSKVGWVFAKPLSVVHKADGETADIDTLKALLMCYAGMPVPGTNRLAYDIAGQLNSSELAIFAQEVFGRWIDENAPAKQKWVLYFCCIHGVDKLISELVSHYIKYWSENMRGAIAAEAVRAVALNGGSYALMSVDGISRKFKNKQVRSAAGEALSAAAEQLGITSEELADRIVPDLGFNDRLCRVFDYGKRQFSVYIKPTLELEIFSGEKRIKALPKPGVTDDQQTASAAYEAFREMKKTLKNVVSTQKERLEYVLMCDRKWSSEGWRRLFVGNAVMHCFAIGLIWGIYADGKLIKTFRYMDDGSFTTAEEDEFTLPEDALVGLVHPLELTAEELSLWKQQLEDYEIIPAFDQLGRKVFLPRDDELREKEITRFSGAEMNSLSLIGKMTKYGWFKGQAEDAGFFYYFFRNDISGRSRNADGDVKLSGSCAMLTFSGASVAMYDNEGETVTIKDIIFYSPDAQPDYWDKDKKNRLTVSQVSPRYFSEIIMQISVLTGRLTDEQS